MDTLTSPIVPPAPATHPQDLPTWRFLIKFLNNTLSAYPERAFDDLIVRARMLGVDSLQINDPDAARHVLFEARELYVRPIASVRPVRPLGGAGLVLAEGDVWRHQRHSLAPVFTPASVEGLIPHFQAAADAMAARLEGRNSVNLSRVFHEATLDGVLRALFSLEPGERHGRMAAMVRGYVTGAGRPNILDGLARLEGDFEFASGSRRRFQKRWFAAVDVIVAERRANPGAGRNDLLGLLLAARDPETGEALGDIEVRDQAATMLFAGFETTSRLLFWASYLICLDGVEQARLRAEVQAFPPDRVAGLADLANWPRLRLTLLEALRLYPPAAHVVRDAIAPDVVLGEAIEPGARVWISPWVIHRHRRFWDHPAAFMPGRFAGHASPWTSGPFMPFGGGPRICIGAAFAMAEAQIVLASLLHRFSLSLVDTRPVMPVANVITGPSHEPMFELERCNGRRAER